VRPRGAELPMTPVVLLPFFILPGWFYLLATAVAARRFSRRESEVSASAAPVSVLKPLAGAAPGLYEDLRSFAEQDYPRFEIVFGVRDPGDEALEVARTLRGDYPEKKILLVVEGGVSGSNLKVANLENMLPAAHGELLVVADSDIGVGPSYLAAVTAPLCDPSVGAVTCLYRGVSSGGFWSRLAALHINYGFLPSALLAASLGIGRGCFGATIAMRREVLERIGGFAPLREELADDYRLGDRVRTLGLSIVLSSTLVDHRGSERDFLRLWRHELRWARTIRAVAPVGHLASLFAHPLALALLLAAALRFDLTSCAFLVISCGLRWSTAGTVARSLGLEKGGLWLLPLRDALSFAVFLASFLGRTVFWRERHFRLRASGRITIEGDKAL
jgi:ceramide glucosyltransferase